MRQVAVFEVSRTGEGGAVTIEIIHADALKCGASLFSRADTLLVDPPYSEYVHANTTSIGTGGRGVRARDLGFDALTPELRDHILLAAYCVKRWSVIFSDYEGSFEWWKDPPVEYVRWIPWVRWSQPQLSGDRPPSGAEVVLHFHRYREDGKPMRKRWNGPGNLTAYDDDVDPNAFLFAAYSRRCLRNTKKNPKHGAEKPLDLLLDHVCFFSDPGETVLDPNGGWGTTAQAARLLDRHAIVIEGIRANAEHAHSRVNSPLSERDLERALEWCDTTEREALAVPKPKAANGSDVKTFERAQRRLADVARVRRNAVAIGVAA